MKKFIVLSCLMICALGFGNRWLSAGDRKDGSNPRPSEEIANPIHPLWGDLSKLTPPPPLQGNPLIITDLERSPANPTGPAKPEEGFLFTGPDGQTFHGRWVKLTPSDQLNPPNKYTLAPLGRVWRVSIEGNGADVWISGNRDSNGNPQNIDFNIRIENCRLARLSGLKAFISDIRTVSGYHPDHSSGGPPNGKESLIEFRKFPDNATIFVEGCDIDMNEGGIKPSYRVDAFSSNNNYSLNAGGTVVLQNSRVMNVSSWDYVGKFDDGTPGPHNGEITHCDIWHFQSNEYLRWLLVENFECSTNKQGFQTNYKRTMLRGSNHVLPEHPLHISFYRMRMHATGKGHMLFHGNRDFEDLPSTQYEQVYLARLSNPWIPRNQIKELTTNPVFDPNYIAARSNIIRKDGTIQEHMVNAGSGGVVPTLFYYPASSPDAFPVKTFAPKNAVGHNFQHIWGQDGKPIKIQDEVVNAQAESKFAENNHEKRFAELQGKNWKKVFSDTGTGVWQEAWFLDGKTASVTNTSEGMHFTAGPEPDATNHAVLWTKESFSGDIKIEYDYTRTDTDFRPGYTTLLYVQATGIDTLRDEKFWDKDITAWRDRRAEPLMPKYFKYMNLLHISYGANDDYIRGRKYPMPREEGGFHKMQIEPDYEDVHMFEPNVKYHITIIKMGNEFYFHAQSDSKEGLFPLNYEGFPEVKEGRIGLRHMATRSALYGNFNVYLMQ